MLWFMLYLAAIPNHKSQGLIFRRPYVQRGLFSEFWYIFYSIRQHVFRIYIDHTTQHFKRCILSFILFRSRRLAVISCTEIVNLRTLLRSFNS